MKHGTIDGLSIGYRVPAGGATKSGKVRELRRIDLVEVSVVTTPADLQARILPESIKLALESARTLRELESVLRESGLSRGDAELFLKVSKSVFQSVHQGEPESGGVGNGASRILSALTSFKL